MPERPASESFDGAFAVPFTRRRLLATGVAVAAVPAALGARSAPGGARGGQGEASPVAGVATPDTDEGSQYRPQETVASPEPQVAGPAVGEETVGPPLATVDAATARQVAPFLALSTALVGGGGLDPRRAVQYLASAEADPAKAAALDELLALAAAGIDRLRAAQAEVLSAPLPAAST